MIGTLDDHALALREPRRHAVGETMHRGRTRAPCGDRDGNVDA